ncbi:hypothetical protein [Xanthomonas oryzae]|uniref:hypothetical protein n=1 Tax=Xanthomonas oryzae TaxID=347 RepID=UPI0014042DE1|nr:hypothetical protein [Xanthomonas oryzae]
MSHRRLHRSNALAPRYGPIDGAAVLAWMHGAQAWSFWPGRRKEQAAGPEQLKNHCTVAMRARPPLRIGVYHAYIPVVSAPSMAICPLLATLLGRA